MADDGSAESPLWPLPAFHFEVTWDDGVMTFQEVSGLDIEARPIDYRAGDDPVFSTIRMPGIGKPGTVTLKKGMFRSDTTFRDWFSRIKGNTTARQPVTIRLMDETGKPTMAWTLANAWPVKITVTDLESDGNQVAIESIEVSHESLTISDA